MPEKAGPRPAAEVRCGHVNFFADSAAAQAWSQAHPQAAGRLLAQRQAWEIGVDIFGPLMRPQPEIGQ
ncbi:organomercurial lyase [Nonomuraea sp. NPDC001636]|uniref:organomercurial lyase n=1 Tax=Nonomuraea sp. NPDC001636 TaxID=3154391 RepID=UPI0033230D66